MASSAARGVRPITSYFSSTPAVAAAPPVGGVKRRREPEEAAIVLASSSSSSSSAAAAAAAAAAPAAALAAAPGSAPAPAPAPASAAALAAAQLGAHAHASWAPVLAAEARKAYVPRLLAFVAAARERLPGRVYPPPGEVFTALQLTPLDRVRCVILGQDPYHQRGQAHGLAFSVARGVPPPPSLRNMLKEAADDVGTPFPPPHGSLARWAQQGVLLLNAVLTVEDSRANAHAQQGWEELTTALLRAVAEGGGGGAQRRGVVFCLWGKPAQETARRAGIVDGARGHVVLAAPHPSPLSAHRGFFGAKPFSRANAALMRAGHAPIDWRLDGPLPPGATAGGSGGS